MAVRVTAALSSSVPTIRRRPLVGPLPSFGLLPGASWGPTRALCPAAHAFRRRRAPPPSDGRGRDRDELGYAEPEPERREDAGGGGWVSPVELVRREAGLQSNRLEGALRERVEAAVERLGGRVTVGDVAARAGVKLAEADEALKALAYDTAASLQVSASGDVVYGFAPDFRARLRNRSLLLRAAPLARRAAGAAAYLARVAFGTALIASVVLVWLAVLALLRGRDNDNDNRRGGGGYYGGGYGSHHSVRLFMDVTDLFIYWDPNYYRTSAQRAASGSPLSFVESIFSFVFGDGDPNADWEERRWRQLGDMIRAKGGVVTAEEMAPFLDPPEPAEPPRARRTAARQYDGTDAEEPYVPYPDESFVLPALIKFGGEPVVDEAGRLLYRFPALQRTGVASWGQKARGPVSGMEAGSLDVSVPASLLDVSVPASSLDVNASRWASRFGSRAAEQQSFDVPLERPWEFTAASTGQVAGTVTLGLVNLLGVGVLGGLLADPRAPYLLAAQGLGWLPGLMGPLQLYALGFFAIPAVRWFLTSRRNAAIESRNEAREAAAELLNGGGAAAASPVAAAALGDKLAAARRLGERAADHEDAGAAAAGTGAGSGTSRLGPRLVSEREIIFDSAREAQGQLGEVEMGDWDARMARRAADPERGSGRGQGGGRQAGHQGQGQRRGPGSSGW
ncbi:hypothetical protein GPECTOR_4g853 [Gonium pectorale]|uniref:Iron-sulfur cluster biosynthesis family protein n=1 Tax=Gonium pectorale TaxID=33097 RepID=A0A150GYE4_GONPE|nr:hypothetical protein GPECTOR_4g853 [Gonium pectorale]|eukprot:KXZ54783.1 hypothetical protein GPECTOR_4g853 [Gonium pectorale]